VRPRHKTSLRLDGNRSMKVATDTLEELGRAVRRWRHLGGGEVPSVFAHDPGSGGSRPTGWCLIDSDGTQISGEGELNQVIEEAGAALAIVGKPALYAREGIYNFSRPDDDDDAQLPPITIYRMGVAAGHVTGGLSQWLSSSSFFEPPPTTWRAALGLNRKRADNVTAREATAEAVWLWARATTGLPLLTPDRRRRIDQAMAIGIAHATLHIAQEAERLVSGG
jgi:hypothetical protein